MFASRLTLAGTLAVLVLAASYHATVDAFPTEHPSIANIRPRDGSLPGPQPELTNAQFKSDAEPFSGLPAPTNVQPGAEVAKADVAPVDEMADSVADQPTVQPKSDAEPADVKPEENTPPPSGLPKSDEIPEMGNPAEQQPKRSEHMAMQEVEDKFAEASVQPKSDNYRREPLPEHARVERDRLVASIREREFDNLETRTKEKYEQRVETLKHLEEDEASHRKQFDLKLARLRSNAKKDYERALRQIDIDRTQSRDLTNLKRVVHDARA